MTAEKKACAQGLVARGVSVVRACLATGLSRSGYYRPEKDWRIADAAVINAINDVLKKSPQAGFWKCFGRLRFQKCNDPAVSAQVRLLMHKLQQVFSFSTPDVGAECYRIKSSQQ